MAGHSKWHNIQHRKNIQDAKRGKIFTKLTKEIIIATKTGGSIIENNLSLRTVIDKALAANMKKHNIENAIKRGSNNADNTNYEQIRYEGYDANGIAIIVDCLSDNRNRTVAEVRHTFIKYGGNLGTKGSVSHLFKKLGIINFISGDENQIIELALNTNAQDVITKDNGSIDILIELKKISTIRDTFLKKGITVNYTKIIMHPLNNVELNLVETEKFTKLIQHIEDLEDTHEIYHNATISDKIVQ